MVSGPCVDAPLTVSLCCPITVYKALKGVETVAVKFCQSFVSEKDQVTCRGKCSYPYLLGCMTDVTANMSISCNVQDQVMNGACVDVEPKTNVNV